MKHKTKKEGRGAPAVRRKRGPASRSYKRRNAWKNLAEEKAEEECRNVGRDLEQSGAPIETTQRESFPSQISCAQINISTSIGSENRSLDDDVWVDVDDEEEFEIIPSLGEIEDEYVLL